MGRNLLLLTFALLFSTFATAQKKWKVNETTVTDTFSSGKIHAVTVTKYKKWMNPPLHEHYESTRKEKVEYYESGVKKSTLKQLRKNATWGRPCGEVIYVHKTWYANGKPKSVEIRKCDKHHSLIKTYNKKGKLLKKTKEKITYNQEDE